LVARDPGHCHEVLDGCERLLAARPEIFILSAHRRVWDDADE